MARRNDHSRDELRGLALEAAGDLLEQGGMAAVTARAVASRIGYAPGTLYNLFQGLDELILALNGVTLDLLGEYLKQAAPRKGESAVTALALAYLEFAAKHPRRWAALYDFRFAETVLPHWYRKRIDALLTHITDALATLAPGRSAGEIQLAAQTLWTAIHGIAALSGSDKLSLGGNAAPETLASQLVTCFLKGWHQERLSSP